VKPPWNHPSRSSSWRRGFRWWLASLCFLAVPSGARAQGGPPLLTNDPGTPGNGDWEINLGVMQVLRQHQDVLQIPQIDLNFGLGDRIQLTYEVPYVLQREPGQPVQTGWGNAFPGVKWRFLDNKGGWNASIFPQLEPPGLGAAIKPGIATSGTRFLLPVEVTKTVGPVNLDFEAGYYFPWHSRQERIIGFAAGHQVTPKLEIVGEFYNDYAMGALPHDTTFDAGGRYKFHKGLLLLFMAGRSLSGNSSGQPEFMGYVGVQFLLEKYGKELQADP
jgi:hypothetical protein